MKDIDSLTKDGFSLPDRGGNSSGLALLSLKIALKAYSSTYQHMKYSLHLFDPHSGHDQPTIDFNHSSAYCEACAEAIVHFQHFAELVCKDILRSEHPLLAVDTSSQHVLLHKLLCGEPLSTSDQEALKSIEFSDTLERLCTLIKEKRLADELDFIPEAKPCLQRLNVLRNRVWHRGTFILRYPALDEFVGQHFFPFMFRVLSMPSYAGLSNLWQHTQLHCGIIPLDMISAEFSGGNYTLGKIAFLKELVRAAYENPLSDNPFAKPFNAELKERSERIAQSELEHGNAATVKNCPVCGVKGLLVYDEVEIADEDMEGKNARAYRYTWQVKCMCCSFNVNHHLQNPSDYGLPIENYWTAKEI